MRNNHLKTGVLFGIIVLLIFSVAAFLFTRGKIDEFNEEVGTLVIEIDNGKPFYSGEDSRDVLEQDRKETWERYFRSDLTSGSGFYYSLAEFGTGEVIIDSTGFTSSLGKTVPALDEKARVSGEDYLKEYTAYNNVVSVYALDKGIFHTTVSTVNSLNGKEYLLTCCTVFKPFQSVLRLNAGTYIAGIMIFLASEAAVFLSFVVLYRNQKNYDLRNQRLARGIAHELKTPLAVTKATVENWEYLDDNMRREHSKNIMSEVDHMSDMVDKLLEVSRINGGNVKMEPEAVDLLQLTGNIKARNGELLRERDIRFTITGDGDSYPVYADPGMMDIVIGNFVSNAIKYCEHEIAVDLIRAGKKITFSITNDGNVIDKKDLDKIWDIFYTTDKARTDRMSNSGVGLSLVKSILDAHKAKYGCTSGAGGTTFKFTMDRYDPAK